MQSTGSLRRGSVIVAALAGVVAASVITVAQTDGLERFSGTTVNMPPPVQPSESTCCVGPRRPNGKRCCL